jgi:hypothetical protein
VVGEDEGPAHPQAIVLEELGPAAVEVALPLAVVEELDIVRWLAAAALLHGGVRQSPSASTTLKGRGRGSSLLSRRGTRKVGYPFTDV